APPRPTQQRDTSRLPVGFEPFTGSGGRPPPIAGMIRANGRGSSYPRESRGRVSGGSPCPRHATPARRHKEKVMSNAPTGGRPGGDRPAASQHWILTRPGLVSAFTADEVFRTVSKDRAAM